MRQRQTWGQGDGTTPAPASAAFTAMEVITVVAVLAIIVAVILPVAVRSTGRARKATWSFALSETSNDPNLVGLYTFDERRGALTANLAGAPDNGVTYRPYGSYGILRNGAMWVAGRWPDTGAIYFDGLTTGIDVGPYDLPATDDNNGLTAVVWFKARGVLRPLSPLLSHGGSTGVQWELGVTDHHHLQATLHTADGQAQVVDTQEVALDAWVCAGMTYDGKELTLYRNGQPAGHAQLTGALLTEPNTSLWFGNRPPAPARCGFWGVIDEVVVFSRALTPAQLKTAYDEGRP